LVERTPGFDDEMLPDTSAELALWLRFDESSFDDGILDESPFEHAAACEPGACPSPVEGRDGGAAGFAGEGECIAIPDAPAFASLTGITVSAWVKLEESAAEINRMAIAKPFGPELSDSFELYFFENVEGDGAVEARFGVDGGPAGTALARPPRTSATGVWFHVAGTWDGESVTLWLGGQPGTEFPLAGLALDDHPVLVGCDDDPGGPVLDNVFAGAIDDVRIYRGALTAVEIGQLAIGEL
jgi:hypothetical protein